MSASTGGAIRVLNGMNELMAAVGDELGVSDWHRVSQERIQAFAEASGDHNWLHTDPIRAAQTPMGSTIAHGLYTLSLGPQFAYSIVRYDGFSMTLNYGFEKVRFPSVVPVDARVRMRLKLEGVVEVPGGTQATLLQTFERDGGAKPVCVASSVLRLVV